MSEAFVTRRSYELGRFEFGRSDFGAGACLGRLSQRGRSALGGQLPGAATVPRGSDRRCAARCL